MPTEHLYVAFDVPTSVIRTFRAPADSGLAREVTQVDSDEVRRAYRRADRYWVSFIRRLGEDEAVAELCLELVAVHGPSAIDPEPLALPFGYTVPAVLP